MTTPRAARCAGCGNVASASWFTFSIDADPGPRGGSSFSTVRTEVRTVRLCPHCCEGPDWSPFLDLILTRGEPAEGYGGQCVVLCSSHSPRRSHRWAKLAARAVITWPESGKYTCPMCYRAARGWKIHHTPAAIRRLAAGVVRRRRSPRRWYTETAATEAARAQERAR